MDLLSLQFIIFQICQDINYYLSIVKLLKLKKIYIKWSNI